MKKIYVLDTNVVLDDPESIFAFADNDVVLPIKVIEEADKFKKGDQELNKNARRFLRTLDSLRQNGDLQKGVSLSPNATGKLFISLKNSMKDLPALLEQTPDNQILATAHAANGILITKDINLRVKAAAVGVPVEDYEHDKVKVDEQYTGFAEFEVTEDFDGDYGCLGLNPNEFAVIKHPDGTSEVGRVKDGDLQPLYSGTVWGLSPRNQEQNMALDLLMDRDIELVSISGSAGCGKTILAIAAALEMVEKGWYKKVTIARPIVHLGKDLGFLPGTVEEKIAPWMQPIFDNLEVLIGGNTEPVAKKSAPQGRRQERGAPAPMTTGPAQELIEQGILCVEPLSTIRGRSMPNQIIIIDEAQQCSRHELLAILTRAGEGTKVILTGDTQQIDVAYMDSCSCGLTICADRFKAEPIFGHLTLQQGERSRLATMAAKLMN